MELILHSISKSKSIAKIQLKELKQMLDIVKQNSDGWFQEVDIFDTPIFKTKSPLLSDYYYELEKNIKTLFSTTNIEFAEYLSELVESQFRCLKNYLQSKVVNEKDSQYEAYKKKKRYAPKISTTVKSYAELSEKHGECLGFKRRLEDMLHSKEFEIKTAKSKQQEQQFINEYLQIQQRLGRCNQAIAKIEEQLQQLDENN